MDDEFVREDVEQATAEVVRMSWLVNGLLVLARAEAKVTAAEPLPLRDIVDERLTVWRPAADERGVAIALRGSIDGRLLVLASPGHLEQVLDNVLSNALEVSPDGGTITVRVEPRGDEVELSVLDEGPGMSDAERSGTPTRARPASTSRSCTRGSRWTSASPHRTGSGPCETARSPACWTAGASRRWSSPTWPSTCGPEMWPSPARTPHGGRARTPGRGMADHRGGPGRDQPVPDRPHHAFGTYTTTELTVRPDAFDPRLDVEFETEEEQSAAA
ncbi:two-component system sensor kinase [Streptomyces sp. NL15-2K]|nr:HAMP domain-containing sensor histidine kinase [Kutzneria buriramensis]WKX11280.1 HAMP domain-containing sensor histidine kinase [Kutzneria buriramensis]GCB47302.1 two-component system sensor kinase [Streptomyces sp. NL15-2K]